LNPLDYEPRRHSKIDPAVFWLAFGVAWFIGLLIAILLDNLLTMSLLGQIADTSSSCIFSAPVLLIAAILGLSGRHRTNWVGLIHFMALALIGTPLFAVILRLLVTELARR
jgi:hypothetical protein